MKTFIIMAIIFLPFNFRSIAQQAPVRKTRFPAGLFTTDNCTIYGLSAGVGSDTYQNSQSVGVISNGLRLEPISQSLLVFTIIFPVDMVAYPRNKEDYAAFAKKVPNEIINGLNLSCGTNAFANVNGITISLLNQSLKNTNGISVTGMVSYSFSNNGIQMSAGHTAAIYSNGILLSAFSTQTYEGRGLQAALLTNEFINFSGLQAGMFNGVNSGQKTFRGLQIGLYNNTQKLRGIQLGLINRNEKRILPFINWNFKD